MENKIPEDKQAEQAVLGSVLLKPTALYVAAANLVADDFFFPVHREIFEVMLALDKRRKPIDVLLVADELKASDNLRRLDGGIAYLSDLANSVPTAENILHYARIVREKATLRRLIAACAEIQSSAHGDFGEFGEFMSEAMHKVSAVTLASGRTAKAEGLDEIAARIFENAERSDRGEIVTKIPTGIVSLDLLLSGGMSIGHLIVPAGLTSSGKSSWAFQVAFRGAEERNIHALICSLEMSKEEVVIKGAANLSRISSDIVARPSGIDAWKAMYAATSRVAKLKDKIRIVEHRKIGDIVAEAAAWRQDHAGPAVIVVDHIQKVQGVRTKNSNRQEEVWGVARELKDLAQDLKLPLIAPAQLDNDAAKDRRAPRLGDIRDSKAIEHEADLVLGIHRPNRSADDGEVDVFALKHRGGKVGKRKLAWRGAWQGFEAQDVGSDYHDDDA